MSELSGFADARIYTTTTQYCSGKILILNLRGCYGHVVSVDSTVNTLADYRYEGTVIDQACTVAVVAWVNPHPPTRKYKFERN